jgi:hypothetical protein
MANSSRATADRRSRRVWSDEYQAWVAPPVEEGGPEKHNASTVSNWGCGCPLCKIDNAKKHRKKKRAKVKSPPSEDV